MEGYFWWLVEKVDPDKKRENYISLLKELFQISYRYSNQMDKNRYEAGVNLRFNFEYSTGFFLGEELNRKPCTVLEMLIGLSGQMEDQVGYSQEKWFWEMIHNLNLDHEFDRVEVDQKINDWMSHTYEPNGDGSIFPLRHHDSMDCRRVELWDQMSAYVNERYAKRNYI